MNFTSDIVKIDTAERNVFGWAYVAVDENGRVNIDKQDDFIDIPLELEKMGYGFVVDSRRGDAMHFKKGVAHLIESIVFTPEKIEKMGITGTPRLAWWIGMHVNDDTTWDMIEKGEFTGFSIGGKGIRTKVDDPND